MKLKISKNVLKVLAIIAGFAVMVIYAGGFLNDKTPPDTLQVLPGRPLPDNANVYRVAESTRSARLDIVGTAASDRRIQISARMGGYVEAIMAGAGDRVTNSQVLALLDRRELDEQLAAGNARLVQAEKEYQRTRRLYETQAVSEQSMTAAQSAFDAAKAHVAGIQVMLTYARIVSPINGIVTERSVEAGDIAAPGQVLLTIYDPQNMRLEVPVPVRLIHKFSPGQTFTARLDAPDLAFSAEVTEIVGEVDPATRTRTVKLRLLDAGENVLPGSYGRIEVEDDPRDTITIPSRLIHRVGQLDMVNLAEGNRMVKRMIRTGRVYGDEVEILSGLNAGDALVENAVGE